MIGKANIGELETVTKLANELWPGHDFEELKEEMRELLLSKTALIALYFNEEQPVAFAQCQLRRDYVEGCGSSPVGYLEGIYVAANERRKGVATALLAYCEDWARDMGCSEFASDCEIDNVASYDFHRAVGFAEANRIICFNKKL